MLEPIWDVSYCEMEKSAVSPIDNFNNYSTVLHNIVVIIIIDNYLTVILKYVVQVYLKQCCWRGSWV